MDDPVETIKQETQETQESGMAMSKQKIWDTYGIDLTNQEKNGRGKIWTEEIKKQVLAAEAKLDEYGITQKEFLKHIGLNSPMLSGWKAGYTGSNRRVKADAPPKGRRQTLPFDDEEEVAASEPRVDSMAPRLAAGKVAKRVAKAAKRHRQAIEADNTLRLTVPSIMEAIKILDAMRHNDEFVEVQLVLVKEEEE